MDANSLFEFIRKLSDCVALFSLGIDASHELRVRGRVRRRLQMLPICLAFAEFRRVYRLLIKPPKTKYFRLLIFLKIPTMRIESRMN